MYKPDVFSVFLKIFYAVCSDRAKLDFWVTICLPSVVEFAPKKFDGLRAVDRYHIQIFSGYVLCHVIPLEPKYFGSS